MKSCSRRRAKAGFFGRAGGVPRFNDAHGSAKGRDGVSWVGGLLGLAGAIGFAGAGGGVLQLGSG